MVPDLEQCRVSVGSSSASSSISASPTNRNGRRAVVDSQQDGAPTATPFGLPSCGDHECTANLDDCDEASVIENACGRTIACSDICSASPACCARPGCDSGGVSHGDSGDDLVVTFYP